MSLHWILGAIFIFVFSGVPGLFDHKKSLTGQKLATALAIAGGMAGLTGIGMFMVTGEHGEIALPWFFPQSSFSLRLDAVSALFLVPIFIMPALGSIYGLSYWKQSEHPENGRKLRLFYGIFAASMAMVVLAHDGILFLIVWEIMAVSAYFLATINDDDPEVCQSGWVYLVATHIGTLCLIAMFALLRKSIGSFAFNPVSTNALTTGMATAVFLLAVIGFGLKAGLMPLHGWLPGTHANAPSHISAMMSGVMIKMGIYGIIRIIALLPNPPAWWGGLLLASGAVSGIMGILFATGQHDLKRLLAYSSIENIGIIVMGLGLALLGRSLDRPDWIALGFGGALLHVWNHSLFKSLMFMGAGAVTHATHTRKIALLGGLAKSMPRTALLFAIGGGAICALPPLNGFVSELLIYVGLFQTIGIGEGTSLPMVAFAAPALAMTGALAAMCFLNFLGAVFLGQARTQHCTSAHDPDAFMIGPMMFLATGCLLIGFAPWAAVPFLDHAIMDWLPGRMTPESLGETMPLQWVTFMGLALASLVALGMLAMKMFFGHRSVASAGTWDCGYVSPSSRMQYTNSSFSQMLTEIFSWALWTKIHPPQITGLFARPSLFRSDTPDLVLDRLVLPGFSHGSKYFLWFQKATRGRIQADLFYILLIVVIILLCA